MMRRVVIVVAALGLVVIGGLMVLRNSGTTAAAPPGTTPTSPAAPTTSPATTAATTTTSSTTSTTTTTLLPAPIEVPVQPLPSPPAPAPSAPQEFDGNAAVLAAAGGVDLASSPGGEPFTRLREGVVLAGKGLSADGGWVRVFHMCDGVAWARLDQLAVIPEAVTGPPGAGFDFADAVFVIDPGHGGPGNVGAVSPDGLAEKGINLVIGNRVRDLLSEPHSIDWETGTILIGNDVPAAASVVMTRVGDGADGDYEAGLDYRSAVANAAGAHAMISIHNNAGWEVQTSLPGSDVYYQSQAPVSEESRRLATLLVEEFRRGFAAFDANWVGAIQLGAKSRLSPRDGVSQYYGVLKGSTVPTVIAEGAYIANPSEAELLVTPEFQHAYAAAVYRALVRFATTSEPGDGPSHDPEVWEGSAGRGGARPECVLPSQP